MADDLTWQTLRLPEPPVSQPIVTGHFANKNAIADASFDAKGSAWTLKQTGDAQAQWTDDAHSGRVAVWLMTPDPTTPASVTYKPGLNLEPSKKYRLTFWAKVESGESYLYCDLENSAKWWVRQTDMALINDGQWHAYEALVETGGFESANAATSQLRLFVVSAPQSVLIDDVTLSAPLDDEPKTK